ncbi:hypothetical protein VCHENC02_0272, partial [Vibrio harveyi]
MELARFTSRSLGLICTTVRPRNEPCFTEAVCSVCSNRSIDKFFG